MEETLLLQDVCAPVLGYGLCLAIPTWSYLWVCDFFLYRLVPLWCHAKEAIRE